MCVDVEEKSCKGPSDCASGVCVFPQKGYVNSVEICSDANNGCKCQKQSPPSTTTTAAAPTTTTTTTTQP